MDRQDSGPRKTHINLDRPQVSQNAQVVFSIALIQRKLYHEIVLKAFQKHTLILQQINSGG